MQQQGQLYEGSLKSRFECVSPSRLNLYLSNSLKEVLTNVSLSSKDVECGNPLSTLLPATEAIFPIRIHSKVPCWLAALRVTYTSTVGLCSLSLALPVGPFCPYPALPL